MENTFNYVLPPVYPTVKETKANILECKDKGMLADKCLVRSILHYYENGEDFYGLRLTVNEEVRKAFENFTELSIHEVQLGFQLGVLGFYVFTAEEREWEFMRVNEDIIVKSFEKVNALNFKH